MRRECKIQLSGCPGVDSPITNISAEAPDPLLFWGVPWNPYNPYRPPPLGNGQYVIEDCPGWFTSLIAQFDPVVYAQTQLWANLQALALQLGCDFPEVGDLTFQNDAQTATVHCPDGSAFSYTVDAGTITATFADPELGAAWVLAANAWALAYAFEQASALLQCGVGDPHIPHIPGDDPPDFPRGPGILENPSWMCFGENYLDNYTITGGSIITNYTMSVIAGAIPPGTVFTQTGPRAANVSGIVTAPGQYTWTIQAVSTSIPTVTVTFQDSLWVMGITNASSLPNGEVGIAYSEVLQGIGGTAPYTFTLDVGSTMPDGLTLASDGTVSGTPTVDDQFTFDVVITDARGGQCTDTVLLEVIPGLCTFACNPEKDVILPAFSSPLVCTRDESSGKIFGQHFDGVDRFLDRLNLSSSAIEASVILDSPRAMTDLVYHPSTGLLYASVTDGLTGVIYAIDPSTMGVVNSVNVALAALKMAVDAEHNRIYFGSQQPAPGNLFLLKSLDVSTMSVTDIATGDSSGTSYTAYIPSTTPLGQGTGIIASPIFGNKLTLYRASDFSFYGSISLTGSVIGMAAGFDSVLGGSLVFSYLGGGVYRIRGLNVAPGFGEFTTAPFLAPAIGSSIQISIGTTVGLAMGSFFIGAIQWTLDSIDSGTQVTVTNLSVVPGTNIPLGTFVFGNQVTDTFFFTSQAVSTSISYASNAGVFMLANINQVIVVNRDTHAAVCTFSPTPSAGHRVDRCDVSGQCNLVVPWDVGAPLDYFKVF